jgi:hypothetical protein
MNPQAPPRPGLGVVRLRTADRHSFYLCSRAATLGRAVQPALLASAASWWTLTPLGRQNPVQPVVRPLTGQPELPGEHLRTKQATRGPS